MFSTGVEILGEKPNGLQRTPNHGAPDATPANCNTATLIDSVFDSVAERRL